MSLADSAPQTASSRLAAPAACLLILFALIDSQVIAAITPQIAAGLLTHTTTVASTVTAYSIFAAVVAIGLAWYRNIPHPRRWLPLAAAVFVVATIVSAAAPHISVLYLGRAVAGFAGGLISALAIAALANASRFEKRGSQMSLVAISYFLAPVLGVPLGVYITGLFGWRTAFLLSAILVGLAGILVRFFPLPSTDAHEDPETRPPAPFEGGLVGAVRRLWSLSNRDRSTRMGIVSAFFVSGGLVGFTTYLATWVYDAFGAGTSEIGFLYAVAGVGAVAGGALGGLLSDRFGKRIVAVYGSLGMGLLLVIVPAFTWGVLLFVLVANTAFVAAVRVAPLQALITEFVAPTERSTYVALRNAASQLGIATAVAAAGLLYLSRGIMGVGILCALLTLGAWITIRRMRDPGEKRPSSKATSRLPIRLARAATVLVLAASVFLLAVLPFTLSFLVTKARTRPDERARSETPATFGLDYESVSFRTTDGVELSGWHIPSTTRPMTIVMTHGLFRSRYELIERGVDLARLGYGVFLYDLRRHGSSRGEFTTLGYTERKDVEAAIETVRARAPHDRIVLFGVSMGAAATLLAAAETNGIDAIVAESSFLSLRHTVNHHLAASPIPASIFGPILVNLTAWRLDYDPDDFDVLEAVKEVEAPILFIGGTSDWRMPNDTVLEPLFNAARNPRKQKYYVEGATHGHSYSQNPEQYVRIVNDFLQTVVPPEPNR